MTHTCECGWCGTGADLDAAVTGGYERDDCQRCGRYTVDAISSIRQIPHSVGLVRVGGAYQDPTLLSIVDAARQTCAAWVECDPADPVKWRIIDPRNNRSDVALAWVRDADGKYGTTETRDAAMVAAESALLDLRDAITRAVSSRSPAPRAPDDATPDPG